MIVVPAATLARTPPRPADDAPHVLLVDDDRRIRDLLSRFLCGEGYRVTTAASASDARAKLLGLHFDLLILDVMMPGETGFDLARFIRISSSVPIIMLTARHEAEARIEGLQIGADDYVAKPFEPRELVLRIGNILKRAAPAPVETLEQVAFGPYVYHLERGELRQGEEVVHLTDREREMLRILAIARGETVPRSALTGDGTVNERAVDVQSAIPPIPCSCRRCAASAIAWSPRLEPFADEPRPMSTLDTGLTLIRTASRRVSAANGRMGHAFKRWMPTGLYARALLIMIVPMVILQTVVAFVFMERHWNTVTRRLSAAVVQDIASLIDVYKGYPQDKDRAQLRRIAQRLQLVVDFLPVGDMPPPGPKPFFSLLDQTLSVQLGRQIGRPFWIDTVGRSNLVEIRIQLDDSVMRIFAQRSAAYASNSEIFIFWMLGTSSILLIVSVLFLRNQIKPILRLADAAESFGKGREAPNFRPRGAREVRRAAQAFLEMKSRIERSIEQRTAMLAGVSHDLRTILTRFKLELALIGDSPEVDGMRRDVDEMSGMLEDYLAFARGDSGEHAQPTDMTLALEELRSDAERNGHAATVSFHGLPVVTVKPASFKRCLANLVSNAARHARAISITGHRDHRYLTVTIDDDGPGIPPAMREEVFKPFLRLDDARNQDEGGTGLGLAIARDIARSHGGDITLGDSPMGGLRAAVRVPV
jgi:two-component system osmolarity sensor histidine kinase EnvZ